MGRMIRSCVLIALLPSVLLAQRDSIHLACPLNEATVVLPPKNQIHYDETDYCLILASQDTTVKAVTNGKVTNVVTNDEDGKWEIVFCAKLNNKEYYFWYSGIKKAIVKRNDVIKEGQAIGYIQAGEKMELLMYDFETPVDPSKYLDCKFLKDKVSVERVVVKTLL